MNQAATLKNGDGHRRGPGSFSRKAILCLAIASGKGGVGKTFFTVNLAVAMGRLKRKVLLVDADLGLPNADIVLGTTPERTLEDCIFRGADLADVVTETPFGIDLLAANSGAREMVALGNARLSQFVDDLLRFAAHYDVLLFDCAPGINSSVTTFLTAAPQSIIVVQPDPSSLIDAYALIKVLHQDDVAGTLGIVVNNVRRQNDATSVFERLQAVTRGYLDRELHCLGTIPHSRQAHRAMQAKTPLTAFDDTDPAARELGRIARRIVQGGQADTSLERLHAAALLEGMLHR